MLRGSAQAERERFLTENWTTLEKVAALCRYRQQISSRYRSEELVPTELRPTIRTIAAMLRQRDTDQTNLPVMPSARHAMLCVVQCFALSNALRCPMPCIVAFCTHIDRDDHVSGENWNLSRQHRARWACCHARVTGSIDPRHQHWLHVVECARPDNLMKMSALPLFAASMKRTNAVVRQCCLFGAKDAGCKIFRNAFASHKN